jgi:serine phosphatase RsbU (regulator of sigma subunit)
VESINRDLKRFLESIQFSDFSQTFSSANLGPTFREVKESFNRVTQEFLKVRSEKEERFLYFQTIVEHVPVGLISYKSDGGVELVNKAALRLINTDSLRNLKTLNKSNKQLADILMNIKAGERTLCKLNNGGNEVTLAITATQFKLHQQSYTLVSLQNIQSEVERERISRELEIGQEVQNQLLPSYDVELPDFEFATAYLPAKEVGGDYYDFIKIDDDHIGIVIGDVSGKGLPAAIYMTFTKGIMQANIESGLSPSQALKKANKLIYQTIGRETFISMIFAILDIKNHELLFSRAGHNPLIHLSQNKIRLLEPQGMALGLSNSDIFDQEMEENKIHIKSGDILVFYTDGFNEAMDNNQNEFGTERILKLIQENQSFKSVEIISKIQNAVKDFIGQTPQHDDRTMIVLKVK